jgi:transposase
MFRNDKTQADQIFAFNLRDLLPADSDVFLYIDLFDSMNIDTFYADYAGYGEHPIDPRLLLRTVFYGLTHGIASIRKLEVACLYDARLRVLSGEQLPDRRTIDRFLIRHAERIDALFLEILKLAQGMGLVALGRVTFDGTKFKANTSKHKAMSYDRMKKAEQEIKEQLAKLSASLKEKNKQEETDDQRVKGEIKRREKRLEKIQRAIEALKKEAKEKGKEEPEDKAQKSFNDLEALPISNKGKEFLYGYNAQMAIDESAGVIVGCELHDCANDKQGLVPVLKQVCENVGAPEEGLLDAGYLSGKNLIALEEAGITPLIATGKGETSGTASVCEALEYDEKRDAYRCLKGKLLPQKILSPEGEREVLLLKGFCLGCPHQASCPLFHRKGRSAKVPPEKERAALKRNAERMQSEPGKESYRRRKVMEAPFGNIKWNKGLKIYVRGREKTRLRIRLFAMAHNIEKLLKAKQEKKAA